MTPSSATASMSLSVHTPSLHRSTAYRSLPALWTHPPCHPRLNDEAQHRGPIHLACTMHGGNTTHSRVGAPSPSNDFTFETSTPTTINDAHPNCHTDTTVIHPRPGCLRARGLRDKTRGRPPSWGLRMARGWRWCRACMGAADAPAHACVDPRLDGPPGMLPCHAVSPPCSSVPAHVGMDIATGGSGSEALGPAPVATNLQRVASPRRERHTPAVVDVRGTLEYWGRVERSTVPQVRGETQVLVSIVR